MIRLLDLFFLYVVIVVFFPFVIPVIDRFEVNKK
jgi:hypothetical protein